MLGHDGVHLRAELSIAQAPPITVIWFTPCSAAFAGTSRRMGRSRTASNQGENKASVVCEHFGVDGCVHAHTRESYDTETFACLLAWCGHADCSQLAIVFIFPIGFCLPFACELQ